MRKKGEQMSSWVEAGGGMCVCVDVGENAGTGANADCRSGSVLAVGRRSRCSHVLDRCSNVRGQESEYTS
jgi:hypothetical protein